MRTCTHLPQHIHAHTHTPVPRLTLLPVLLMHFEHSAHFLKQN